MTSELPSTSKADPSEQVGGGQPARPGSRARTSAPRRPAPRQRSRPGQPAGEPVATAESGQSGPENPPPFAPGVEGPPRHGSRPGPRPGSAPRPQPFRNRRLVETAGPDPDESVEQVRLAVGVIVGIHGLKGELKLQLWTDTPEQLKSIRSIWVGDERQTRRLTGVRLTPDRALIRIGGVSSPEVARTFVGQQIHIAGTDARPLDEGELFLYQIVGLRVLAEDGDEIGTIADVMETGANDVLVIKPAAGGPDILYPHHREFVLGVDLVAGTMTVRPLDFLN